MRKLIFILLTSSLSVLFNISCSPSDSIQDEEIPPTEDKGKQPSPTPSEDKNEMKTVDLGLSVEWADKNYNSKDSYDVGDYVENYTQKGAPIQRIYNVPKEFDIPNAWQARELLRMCKWIVQEKDGHKYFKVIGPNGNHIIMPMGGNLFKQLQTFEYYNKDKKAEYLYESDGYGMQEFYMDENGDGGLYIKRTYSTCIPRRFVKKGGRGNRSFYEDKNFVPKTEDAVDLGLSVKWAPYNIGGAFEDDYGIFIAWGDPTGKMIPRDNSYLNGVSAISICGTEKDAATMLWKYGWRMPTKSEFEELLTKCTWSRSWSYGHAGYWIKGPSGKSIFLPAAGYTKGGTTIHEQNTIGQYWTGDHTSNGIEMYYIEIRGERNKSILKSRNGYVRCPIRPVIKNK